MLLNSAYFSVFFEFFKNFQQMLINFFMALKYGIRAFKRTWTRKKYLKLAFLCSVEVWKFVSFLGHFGSFLAKKTKNDKNTPQNTLKSPILSKFQIGPDFSIFIVWSCYYARWEAQTWYFSVVPGPDMTKILSFRQKAKTSARPFWGTECPNYDDRNLARVICTRQAHRWCSKNFAPNGHLPANEKNWWLCLVGAHTWGAERGK